MNNHEKFAALRAEGLTYREIAARCGCSYQYVAQVLSSETKCYFHPFSEKQVIYTGLRDWLNDNKITVTELIRQRYGYMVGGQSHHNMTLRLNGKTQLRMEDIEFFLKLAGKTYEELFHNKEGA